jgi:hypothetical protein
MKGKNAPENNGTGPMKFPSFIFSVFIFQTNPIPLAFFHLQHNEPAERLPLRQRFHYTRGHFLISWNRRQTRSAISLNQQGSYSGKGNYWRKKKSRQLLPTTTNGETIG